MSAFRFTVSRCIHALGVLVGLSVLVFMIVQITGDPALAILPPEATVDEVNTFRDKMGFNDPLHVQYLRFAWNALHLDFGTSFHQREPALWLVAERMPATLELGVAAMVVALVIALPTGVLAAVKKDRLPDYVAMIAALLGQSMPVFWLGLMLIMVFAFQLNWLPTSGRGSLAHLVLPAVTLGMYTAGRVARLTRNETLEVLGEDFIRTARAKGLAEINVIGKHAFRNAAVPVLTIVGLELGSVLGGAVITETVFAWPGVGRLIVQAIYDRDFPVVQAGVAIVAVLFVVVNLLVDLSYGYLDPRIRQSEG